MLLTSNDVEETIQPPSTKITSVDAHKGTQFKVTENQDEGQHSSPMDEHVLYY